MKGEKVMAYSSAVLVEYVGDFRIATLGSLVLQAWTYVDGVRKNSEYNKARGKQLLDLIDPVLPDNSMFLDLGAEKATTLSSLLS